MDGGGGGDSCNLAENTTTGRRRRRRRFKRASQRNVDRWDLKISARRWNKGLFSRERNAASLLPKREIALWGRTAQRRKERIEKKNKGPLN